MKIRKAEEKDKGKIMDLLSQVLMVHHRGRPDLFKGNVTKYTEEELSGLIHNPQTPILVAVRFLDMPFASSGKKQGTIFSQT